MAPATDAELQRVTDGCTSDRSAKMIPVELQELYRSYVPEQAPQGAMVCGLGWCRGPHGPEEQHDF